MSEVDKWIEVAKRCKYLPEDDLRELCNIVCDLLLEEPNVQPVQTPVTVCGDIHGQVSLHLCKVCLVYVWAYKSLVLFDQSSLQTPTRLTGF